MKNVRVLYTIDQLPAFQNRMYPTEAEAKDCPKGNMRLVQDLSTGLIYNDAFEPELMIYDENYQNEQATSPLFKEHLEKVSDIIERNIGYKKIIEVGCGKGHFLEMLLAKGFDVTGYDPTYQGSNPDVVKEYFMPGLGIRADGFILRHGLEHVQDPVSFLKFLQEANGGTGKIYIEVPCFDWICEHRTWFDIFYEHVNYFRLSDFHRIFGNIYESGKIFGGQYLYVVADIGSIQVPSFDSKQTVNFPDDFLSSLDKVQEGSEEIAVWGGASKGVIFGLLSERAGLPVKTVIDINPAKQGNFLPATGIKVQSPVDALSKLPFRSTILVMNSNYLEEIKEMSGNNYNYICLDGE